MSNRKIILFPGLAADIRVFGNVEIPENSICVDYLSINFNDDIIHITNSIILKYDIRENDVLIAVSFGGILATRIKEKTKCRVVLIGSMINISELGYLNLFILRLGLYKLIEIKHLPRLIVKYVFGLKTESALATFYSMMEKYSSERIMSMIEVIRYSNTIDIHVNERIHGKYDKLIASPINSDKYINGGHIISISENNNELIRINTIA